MTWVEILRGDITVCLVLFDDRTPETIERTADDLGVAR
jgi:hypothetical protein